MEPDEGQHSGQEEEREGYAAEGGSALELLHDLGELGREELEVGRDQTEEGAPSSTELGAQTGRTGVRALAG
jgi:hypothetical protein